MRPRYRSPEEDSSRWEGFTFREGDIVVSTRSKSGTTWVQQICALLVHRTPEFPQPLHELSPWLDWLVAPVDEVYARLEAQRHRRIVKTHTPLDGLPRDARASYVVIGRHPLDMAVSLYHQGNNIDRDRLAQLTGAAVPAPSSLRPPLEDWLREWIAWDGAPASELDSLPGVMFHLRDAWFRRHERNVVLLHYADLLTDLAGEMARLAGRLGIVISQDEIAELAPHARFATMRGRSGEAAPGSGVLREPAAFFRRGTSGAGRETLAEDDLAAYLRRAQELAPNDLLTWLHR